MRDPNEMLGKLDGHVFVKRIVGRQLDGDLQHVLGEHGDPRGAVSLLEAAAGGQRRAAVEDADVVQPEEAAFKQVLAKAVFAVYPPTEVQHQLRKRALEELEVALPFKSLLRAVEENRRPGVYRRIDVAEVPLVGRDLTGRMQEELLQHQVELFFGEIHIDCGECDGVERQVPRRIPRDTPTCRASR